MLSFGIDTKAGLEECESSVMGKDALAGASFVAGQACVFGFPWSEWEAGTEIRAAQTLRGV